MKIFPNIKFSRWIIAACFSFSIASCTKETIEFIEQDHSASMQIQEQLSKIIAEADFSFYTDDFSMFTIAGLEYINHGAHYLKSENNGFELITSSERNQQSPFSSKTLGTVEHMLVRKEAVISFENVRTTLGFHISLDHEQVALFNELKPEQGEGIFLKLPQFRVVLSTLNEDGEIMKSMRVIPVSATYAETSVEKNWYWINTSILGEASGLKILITSPSGDLETILIDNLTYSEDFTASTDFFTIALIPDTQKYTEETELNEIFDSQTTYLVEQKVAENIIFASHLGDIVENGDLEAEWVIADNAMSYLDGIVPYGIVIGNHDFQDEWNDPQQGSPLFNKYFPESRFSVYPWWGGFSPDSLSSYQLFPTPLGDFLYLHLTVDSPPPTVVWAQQVLDEHPGMPALITTHAYLRENGRIPTPYLSGLGGTGWDGISADELFDSLIAVNNQVFMVTCGHISAEHTQVSVNNQGNAVYELLQDYQNRENGGEGLLRLLRFYPGHNLIQAITYSPWMKMYEADEDSYFIIDVNFGSRFSGLLP